MSDFDRELIEVITDVDGEVWELRELVELRGATLVSRVVADGFAEVFQASDEDLFRPRSLEADLTLQGRRYLTTEGALQAIERDRIPDDYRIAEARGAIDLQYEPTLVFRYAADDPEAVAEVRRLHDERRRQWLQERKALSSRVRKSS